MQRSPRHFVVFWLFYALRIQSCPLVKTLFERWTTCLWVIVILGRWLSDIMRQKRYAVSSLSKFLAPIRSHLQKYQSSKFLSLLCAYSLRRGVHIGYLILQMPYALCLVRLSNSSKVWGSDDFWEASFVLIECQPQLSFPTPPIGQAAKTIKSSSTSKPISFHWSLR